MAQCENPKKAFILGIKDNGKKDIKFTSKEVDHLELKNGDRLEKAYDTFITPNALKVYKNYDLIPCGKCLPCRLKKAQQWSERCMCELQEHKKAYFLTITYDDEHVPMTSTKYDEETGEPLEVGFTLCKDDLRKFNKVLRTKLKRHNKPDIRFFACGEYASRPHYHGIYFGLELDDLSEYKYSICGDKKQMMYNSPFLDECWKKGFITVQEVTPANIAYTCRYVQKKLDVIDKDIYDNMNIEKEFILMSRKPGIGKNYFDTHNVCYATFFGWDLPTEEGSFHVGSNPYFDKLYDIMEPYCLSDIKAKRKELALNSEALKLSKTSLDSFSQKMVAGNKLAAKVKCLGRKEKL